ncbi:MAG: HAMP domain-containing histidine kinase [Proteobacteria bacterium]|nr:HAMP domain-containing histidine kinase [Pseudomonadota bacterium]MBU1641452.1 HAMP domain-containing histidine kinase [Pseudomonadota bacterium]
MMTWSLAPLWAVDLLGSLAMIVVSSMCLLVAGKIFRRDRENALGNYLLWLCFAIFAFAVSRSLGHILKHILYFAGYSHWWRSLAPISGSINTITFVVIASSTLYFRRIESIMDRMGRDRDKISSFSRELLELNRDIETIVSERTQTEMALFIAHEVRNPAMIIGGMARKMKKSSPESGPDKRYVETIIQEAGKLEALVQGLGKGHPSARKKFASEDLNEIAAAALRTIKPEAENRGVAIVTEYHPAPLIFLGSKHLLTIAIIHLVRNALDACREGDRVEIVTRPAEKAVQVLIRDSGPGIAPEIVEHIFEPFFETSQGPTGIGLPYVKQIVEEQKGRIVLTSTPGEGTTVLISLSPLLGELSRPIRPA